MTRLTKTLKESTIESFSAYSGNKLDFTSLANKFQEMFFHHYSRTMESFGIDWDTTNSRINLLEKTITEHNNSCDSSTYINNLTTKGINIDQLFDSSTPYKEKDNFSKAFYFAKGFQVRSFYHAFKLARSFPIVAVVGFHKKLYDSLKECNETQKIIKQIINLYLEHQETVQQAESLINSCTTVNKLLVAWPEIREFLPKEAFVIKSNALPTIPIDAINKKLGLPTEKA